MSIQPSSSEDDGMLSPTSPTDNSDATLNLAPEVPEPEPAPGLNGNPVHWYDADRTEPYTRIEPFQERQDTSIEFFYKPVTLTALAVALAALGYVATTQDVLEEGRDKRRVYALCLHSGRIIVNECVAAHMPPSLASLCFQ